MSDKEKKLSDASQPRSHPWALWDRYIAGDELSNTQSDALRSALRNDAVFRQNAIGEQTVDQLLKSESETLDLSEAFVSRVLAKCNSLASETRLEELSGQTSVNMLDRGLLENINKDRRQNRRDNPNLYRHSIVWFAIAATVLVSLAGTGFWFQQQKGVNISDTSPDQLAESKGSKLNLDSSALRTSQEGALESPVDQSNMASDDANNANAAVSKHDGSPDTTSEPDGKSYVLATVTDFNRLGESSKITKGLMIGQETIEIDQGEIILTMTCGARVNVFAPCRLEFISENSLRLITGELSVSVPSETPQFQLQTPAVAITNSGSLFDVMVEESGRTEVEVRRGGIAVEALQYPNVQAWDLNAEAINFLTIYTPEPSSEVGMQPDDQRQLSGKNHGPIASLARSLAGESKGVITFNGQSRSFDDEIVFTKVREQVFRRARSSTDQFTKNWSQFVETATSQPQPAGSIQLNGKEYPFENYNEAVLAQNNVLAQFAPTDPSKDSNSESNEASESPVSNPAIPGGFQGTLFIRGERRDFRTFEEYQSAMKELMGPAAEFGFFPFGK